MWLQFIDTNKFIQASRHHNLPQDVNYCNSMIVTFVDAYQLPSMDVVGMDRLVTWSTEYQIIDNLHAEDGFCMPLQGAQQKAITGVSNTNGAIVWPN